MACVKKRPFIGEYSEHNTKILTDLGFINVDNVSELSVWKNGEAVVKYTPDDWVCDYASVIKRVWGTVKIQGRSEGIELTKDSMRGRVDNFLKGLFGYE